jgi:Lon protease-like protein
VEPGHEESQERNPPISQIVCAGRVTHLQSLDDGRFFLIFASLGRAHLIGEDLDSHSYRVGRVEWLEPGLGTGPDDLGLKLEVYRAFERYAATRENLAGKLGQLRDLNVPLGRLVDMLASCMPLDIELQRRLLVELDPSSRALLLLTILASVNGRSDRFSVH